MTGCRCHDPAVFGHTQCDLAPVVAGPAPRVAYQQAAEERNLDATLARIKGQELRRTVGINGVINAPSMWWNKRRG